MPVTDARPCATLSQGQVLAAGDGIRLDNVAALADLNAFCKGSAGWVIEGCYSDLIAATLRWEPELIFMNPGEEVCLRHCRSRPWEPSKFASKAEQDEKLDFLLKWVSDYYTREGTMSLKGHRAVFDAYSGPKRETR